MKLPSSFYPKRGPSRAAFTLIEVMIAITIFFMAMFTILGVLSSSLHAASILRNSGPTAGMVAAQLTLTNKLQEGSSSGNFSDIPIYEGYRWTSQTSEAATNGLFRVEFAVFSPSGGVDSTLTILLYRPDSQSSQPGIH